MKPSFATARLVLRPVRADDAALLFELDADAEVRRFVDQPEPPTMAMCEAVVARMRSIDEATPALGFWIAEEAGAFVGWFHLKPPREGEPAEPGDLELGYRLVRRAWGRGLATEGSQALVDHGLRAMHAPRVTAVAFGANHASIAVMRKLGMTMWREWVYHARASGEAIPAVIYARPR